MHELSVCRALIAEIEAVARRYQASGVASVRLLIGPLSGVEPTLVQHAFSLAAAGTPAAGAGLVIEEAPVRVTCDACRALSAVQPNRLTCAACGNWRTRLVSGDELMLVSVELLSDTGAEALEGARV